MENFSVHKSPADKIGFPADHELVPVTLFGVIVPRGAEFKLVCASGAEYLFETDPQWRQILANYCWQDVKVKGLLQRSTGALLPKKVFPKGPTGDRGEVIDIAAWKKKDLVKKLAKNVADFVLVPAAVFAVMS